MGANSAMKAPPALLVISAIVPQASAYAGSCSAPISAETLQVPGHGGCAKGCPAFGPRRTLFRVDQLGQHLHSELPGHRGGQCGRSIVASLRSGTRPAH